MGKVAGKHFETLRADIERGETAARAAEAAAAASVTEARNARSDMEAKERQITAALAELAGGLAGQFPDQVAAGSTPTLKFYNSGRSIRLAVGAGEWLVTLDPPWRLTEEALGAVVEKARAQLYPPPPEPEAEVDPDEAKPSKPVSRRG